MKRMQMNVLNGALGTRVAARAAPDGNTPAECDGFIRDETAKWVQIIRDLKLRAD